MSIFRLTQRPSTNAVALAVVLLILTCLVYRPAAAAGSAKSFKLDNGLQVVVVPHHRAALVTHSIWYRAGAADDPPGQTGLAHFVEHLMFKDVETHESGSFSKLVARLGGQDDGATDLDVTYYYQSIARAHLDRVMALEAARMARLRLSKAAVKAERDVVLEELASDPVHIVFEDRMRAALYLFHPYGNPVIGRPADVASLSREQALEFHRRHYAPNNAVVVIVGDVTVDEVKAIAAKTYGMVPTGMVSPNPMFVSYQRRHEPRPGAARRIRMRDPRVGRPIFKRLYRAVNKTKADPGTTAALRLLTDILAIGPNSRLYRSLVTQQGIVTSTDGAYFGARRDYSEVSISAEAASGHSLSDVEAAVDRVIADVVAHGVTPTELERSKRRHRASLVYQSDSQQALAERYGINLATGMTIAEVEGWSDQIRKVTAADILAVARKYLDMRSSVTGFLKPLASGSARDENLTSRLLRKTALSACP